MPLRPDPIRTMTVVNSPVSGDADGALTSDDVVVTGLQASTHWDALAHFSYGGSIYNGHRADTIGAGGATRCGIGVVGALVSRGVLLDVARVLGVGRLEPGYPISVADLDAAESQAGITVEPGDIVLVRTGFVQLVLGRRPDRQAYGGAPSPGLTVGTARWFHDRDVAAVAVDNYSFEVYPWEYEDGATAVHVLHLVEMGMLQGQNWVLEDLAVDCAADGRYTFLLDATPLPFTAATGAPVHPVALK
jgi:kynurenine formamidase